MTSSLTRRTVLQAGGAAAITAALPTRFAIGATAKIRIGLMLPFTGTYTALGESIAGAVRLAVAEAGGRFGGREVELVSLDDESNPGKAPENANRLINGDKVDAIIGTVHSGVAMGMLKVTRETGTITVIPNAAANAATGALCAPNVFRTSNSAWQICYPMGKVAIERGLKRVVTITWKYLAGDEMVGGFVEAFTKAGGTVVEQIQVPFPGEEFQAYLTQIAAARPDGVFTFFSGSGALKFVKDYAAAGLGSIPLMGPGVLTSGLLEAMGPSAEGVLTTLNYADTLDLPQNHRFRAAFRTATGKEADVFAVQGYDAAKVLQVGLDAVKGDTGARDAWIAAMAAARIDSPRGVFTFSKAHNPIQDIYLRQVKGGREVVLGVAQAALEDPARGCKMV
jgi:branched-chain amino acid transport system substrate-binding protein